MEIASPAYKHVIIPVTGDSQTGKTTFIKGMQAISAIHQMGVPAEEQGIFFSTRPFIAYAHEIGFDVKLTFDQLGFRYDGMLNVPKVEDFINHPKVRPSLEKDIRLEPFLSHEKGGHLHFNEKPSNGVNLSSPQAYDTIIGVLEGLTDSKITLKDYAVQSRSTRMHSLKASLENDQAVNFPETVWVDIGQQEYVLVTIKDAAGQDSFKDVRPELYRDINAGIILFSMTEPQSLRNIGKPSTSISFPTYEKLDQTNLALVLKSLYTNNREEYDSLTSKFMVWPKLLRQFRENPYVFFKELGSKEDPKNIAKFIQNSFPRELYEPLYEKYKDLATPGWLQEMYNSRWVLKQSDTDTVMVPVVLFGNKADLAAEVKDKDIIGMSAQNDGLPYITGSAIKLQNVQSTFQAATLMGLRISGQIDADTYYTRIAQVQNNILGNYSLGEWAQRQA